MASVMASARMEAAVMLAPSGMRAAAVVQLLPTTQQSQVAMV